MFCSFPISGPGLQFRRLTFLTVHCIWFRIYKDSRICCVPYSSPDWSPRWVDVLPMIKMKLDKYSVLSAFVFYFTLPFIVVNMDLLGLTWWLKGGVIGLVLALPMVIIVSKDDKQSVVPMLIMSTILGEVIGILAHFLSLSWLVMLKKIRKLQMLKCSGFFMLDSWRRLWTWNLQRVIFGSLSNICFCTSEKEFVHLRLNTYINFVNIHASTEGYKSPQI